MAAGDTVEQDLFETFRKDRKNFRRRFMQGLRDVQKGYSRMNASCLKIISGNAKAHKSFSKASCVTEPIGEPVIIGSFFHSGIELLKRYKEDADCLPDDLVQRTALKNLILYLKEEEPPEELFYPSKSFSELEWTVLIAQHILSKLAGQTYIIDIFSQEKYKLADTLSDDDLCPCSKHEKLSGEFDDTSFGCKQGWHGRVDILIGVSVNMKAPKGSFEEDDRSSIRSDSSGDSAVEVKKTSTFGEDDQEQLISECIVYSFLQKKYDNNLSLVPTIGISKKQLIITFYDCENDILITSADLQLEDPAHPGELHPSVIVLLWLTLNYKIFGTGVPELLLQHKADFRELVGDNLEYYKSNVERGNCSVMKAISQNERFAFAERKGVLLGAPTKQEKV